MSGRNHLREVFFLSVYLLVYLAHDNTQLLSNHNAHYLGVILILVALFIGWKRGGFFGAPFLLSFIIAYPLLAPFIAIDVLGYRYFSGYAGFVQEVEFYAPAVFMGALLLLYAAIAISPLRSSSQVLVGRVNISPDALLWLVILSVTFALIFAYLGDYGEGTILTQSYLDVVASRDRALAFTGGAWAVFMVLGYYLALYGKTRYAGAEILTAVFYVGLGLAAVFFLLHGRRVELAGYAVFLMLSWAGSGLRVKNLVLVLLGVLVLDYVGNIRLGDSQLHWFSTSVDFNSLPGGAGNIAVGYVAAFWLVEKGGFELLLGQTYLDQLIRLPPAFLGLDRPPLAYDYVNDNFRLIGGEYFLMEPLINFGIIGLPVFVIIFSWITNFMLGLMRDGSQGEGIVLLLVAGTYIALSYRTVWYGISPLVKPLIIAFLVGFAFDFSRRRAFPD